MKKIIFLVFALVCMSCGQAFADYSLSFMSTNGNYGFTGTLFSASNGNGPLLVTGASLTGNGNLNNGFNYALLAPMLTAVNSDGAGANLSGANNLIYPGQTPIFNSADTYNGMIFVQSIAGLAIVNGSVNSSTNNVPAIGIWVDSNNTYQYWQSWTATGSGSATASLTNATATPIPAAAWLLGSGLLGLVGMRRRKA